MKTVADKAKLEVKLQLIEEKYAIAVTELNLRASTEFLERKSFSTIAFEPQLSDHA